MLENIKGQAESAIRELLAVAGVRQGEIVLIGCSTSEIAGEKIGTHSSEEIGEAVFEALYPAVEEKRLYLAAQCCEHLNRALVIEREAAERYGYEIVNAVPQPKAGGSFATAAYRHFTDPVLVEEVKAACGIDIGGTLIGMNLRRVAVPLRLSVRVIGEAPILCARTRPKYIGGSRACYATDER